MNSQDSEFFKQLLSMFKMESEEHVKVISSALLQLGKKPSAEERLELLETVFRAAHSLKGASRAVGLTDVEPISQSLEKLFATLKHTDTDLSSPLLDKLHRVIENFGTLISTMNEQGKVVEDKSALARLIEQVNENVVLMMA
jgi:two-component system chemotaxis sensor kinase CheA